MGRERTSFTEDAATTGFDGGPGADTLVGGGVEADTVNYSDRVNPVFVSLNGRRDDGEAGERDLIVNIRHVVTGSGADVIVGNADFNVIDAGAGNDVVYAGGENDGGVVVRRQCSLGRFDVGAPAAPTGSTAKPARTTSSAAAATT